MATSKQILKKTGRIILYIFLGLLGIILLLVIFINLPVGKRVVRNQVVSYLEGKLHTKVSIGSIDYSLPKWLKIQNVYVEDQHKDTLLFGQELSIDLNMIKLIQGNTDIRKIYLKNILVNVNRPEKDSFFNYQFIINAFTGNQPSAPAVKDTAEMKLTMQELIFDGVALKFRDKFGGNDFSAKITHLDLTMDQFQPDRMKFLIDRMSANGIDFTMDTYKESTTVDAEAADTSSAASYALLIAANNIDLRNINVLVDNRISGLHYANKVTHLGATNLLYDMDQFKGTADSLLLDSSAIIFTQPKAMVSAVKKDSVPAAKNQWTFAAKNLNIGNTFLKYDDNSKAAADGLDFSHLNIRDMFASVADFKFSADTTKANIAKFSFADTSGFALDTARVNFIMTDTLLAANDMYIKTPHTLIQKSFSLRYDSLAAIATAPQNTLLNAMLTNSRIAFDDIYLLVPALKASLPPAQFANQYINIHTELRGNLERLYLPYFQLSGLSGSRIQARGNVYNLTDPKKFAYDLYIDKADFFKKDLMKFVPAESQQQLAQLPDVFNLQGHFVGTTNNITADLRTNAKDFGLNGRFVVNNISDPKKLQFDANVGELTLTRNLIEGFMPPAARAGINIPQRISASGKLTGNTNNINTDLKIASSFGSMAIKGYVNNISDTKNAAYDLKITTPGFALGTLLKQDTVIGSIAGTISAKGKGFDYKTMQSVLNANIASLQYNKYNYRNASINAVLQNGLIKSAGSIADNNLKVKYNINANVRNKYPAVEGYINVDTARLQALHLYADTLNFSGDIAVNAQSLQPRSLNASVILDSAWLQMGVTPYLLDSLSLIATSLNGIDSIKLWAPFAEMTAGGAFDYDKIGVSLQRYINRYYKFPGLKDTLGTIRDQQLAFNGVIKPSPIVTGLVPALSQYRQIDFSGSYASADSDSALNFNANIPYLRYGTNTISDGNINVASRNEQINYLLKFDTLRAGSNILYATNVNGAAARDSISLNAHTNDNKNKDWFGLSGIAFVKNDVYTFKMKDTLLLNYEQWNVAPDNFIAYSDNGIQINNFLLNSDTSRIFINSVQQVPNSPIDINIEKFNLRSISSLISGDTLLASGVLNVKASVSDLDKRLPAFTGNAGITDLEFMQHPLGTLTAFAEKQTDNSIAANMALTGEQNDIAAKGNYYLNDADKQFDADLRVNRLSFETLEAFSGGALKNSSGNIHGAINANGKFTDPRWKGAIQFDTTKFTLTQLGTPYRIDNQTISFDYPRVSFPNFTILDSLNHTLRINGFVGLRTMTEYDLGVDVNATDFILMNAPKAINSQFYGYAAIDANISVTGTSTAPDIQGDIYVNDKSNVFIVLPEKSYAKDEGLSVVRFIDRDTFDINPPVMPFEEARKENNNQFGKFLNYNLNIEITKDAALTIIVDPVTTDQIKVQGDARLNAGVDPGGNIVLAGTYELDNGYYDMHYQFLQRKFNLVKGSTINFAGEPMDARIDITAEYDITTSAKELLSSEIAEGGSLSNSLNQKLPFKVVLHLTGQLSKPTIGFDIQLAAENATAITSELQTTIENKLTQLRGDEAGTNKQVFSLLLLNKFVGEQSSDFFKGNGSNFSDIARQSVSQFLSGALNQLAGDIFKGIDIDLNLNSYNDYTTGGNEQKTDLNVAISKNFLNDRLTVSVGKNFGVEGQNSAAKAGAESAGFSPDITLSYKLTPDGKYLLRAYTRNQFEVTVDGYVVENGVAFIVTMDYDKFRELFQRKKRKK